MKLSQLDVDIKTGKIDRFKGLELFLVKIGRRKIMESLRELYKVGVKPSSSHTMGPKRIAENVLERYPHASRFHVDLHGSLALTEKDI